MPLRSDWSRHRCPIARSLDVVGDPWVLLVVREALQGTRRFDDFRQALGCADTVLSRRLAAMVEDGLLERVPYEGGLRARHEYRLTAAGTDLLPLLNALVLWGEKHTAAPGPGRMELLHEGCGERTQDAGTCTACHRPLAAGTLSWVRPWREDPVVPLVR